MMLHTTLCSPGELMEKNNDPMMGLQRERKAIHEWGLEALPALMTFHVTHSFTSTDNKLVRSHRKIWLYRIPSFNIKVLSSFYHTLL